MNKKLRKRLEWLWDNRTSSQPGLEGAHARWRYVPRAFSAGGSGWGVFDRAQERFLSDAEVVELPMTRLQAATHLS